MFALGECIAAIGGCASKRPEAESTVSASAAVQPSSKSPSSSTTGGTPTGGAGSVGAAASGSASADRVAGSTGGSASGVASGNGVSGDRSAGSATAGSAMPPSMEAQTSEERRAVLDKRLDDSLGAFDAKLRSEQQKLAQERDARQTAVTTVAASGASDANNGDVHGKDGSTDDSSGSNSPGETGNSANRSGANRGRGESRSARAGDLKSDRSTAGANGNASGNGAVANEIPDGSDDDIVARRLRKAAEQETDPELKDKLWKEYVEYKKNTQGK
jgi:hypothetical protein